MSYQHAKVCYFKDFYMPHLIMFTEGIAFMCFIWCWSRAICNSL